jgi:hypothetical protein
MKVTVILSVSFNIDQNKMEPIRFNWLYLIQCEVILLEGLFNYRWEEPCLIN